MYIVSVCLDIKRRQVTRSKCWTAPSRPSRCQTPLSKSLHNLIILLDEREVKTSALSSEPLPSMRALCEVAKFGAVSSDLSSFCPWPGPVETANSPPIDKGCMGVYDPEQKSTNMHLCFAWYCVKLCMRLGKKRGRAPITSRPHSQNAKHAVLEHSIRRQHLITDCVILLPTSV